MIAKAINSIFEAGYKRVIVPGFGAFIKRNSGEIVFTDMLSEDDGVLIASLIGSGLNVAEARQAVEKFIVSQRSELARSGRTSIAGIGIITKTANGGYVLEAETLNEIFSEPVEEKGIQEQTPTHIDNNTVSDTDKHETITSVAANNTSAPEHKETDTVNIVTETPEIIVETIIEESVIPESAIESEDAAEDFIHPSFVKKARLRSALYGDSEAERETEQREESAIAAVQNEPESTPENIKSDEDYTDAKADIGHIKPEEHADRENIATKTKEIHTVKSDFTVSNDNSDKFEPYKPQINIRRPAKSKKRIDGVMVVAIIALIITVGIIVYGYFAERDINTLKGEDEIMIEMEQQIE